MKDLLLFFDDTGTRDPGRPSQPRHDGMDCFGLGGILIFEEKVEHLKRAHRCFCNRWSLETTPLHSHEIRGRRNNFAWLKDGMVCERFLSDLENFLTSLPVLGIAAIIDRPGFMRQHPDCRHHMNKVAFALLIERAAKVARLFDRKLRIFHEQAGKHEDQAMQEFLKDLKTEGWAFFPPLNDRPDKFAPEDFRNNIRGKPKRQSKKSRMMQIADLYLYPMAKAGYDPEYQPYLELLQARRLIDGILPDEMREAMGIIHYGFENEKGRPNKSTSQE